MPGETNPYRPPQGDGLASAVLRPPKPISVWLMQGIYALLIAGRTLSVLRNPSVVDGLISNAFALVVAGVFVVGIQLRYRWAQWSASVLLAVAILWFAAPTVTRFGESTGSAYELGELIGAVLMSTLVLLLGYKVTLGRASRSYFNWHG